MATQASSTGPLQEEIGTTDLARAPGQAASATDRSFEPYFVVLHDKDTGQYHHPHVHYVFEGDEPDALTNAVVDSLTEDHETVAVGSQVAEPSERLLLIDVEESGQRIRTCNSLTAHWRPSHAGLTSAPTFDHVAANEGGLMLTIQGQSVPGSAGTVDHILRDEVESPVSRSNHTAPLLKEVDELARRYKADLAKLTAMSSAATGD